MKQLLDYCNAIAQEVDSCSFDSNSFDRLLTHLKGYLDPIAEELGLDGPEALFLSGIVIQCVESPNYLKEQCTLPDISRRLGVNHFEVLKHYKCAEILGESGYIVVGQQKFDKNYSSSNTFIDRAHKVMSRPSVIPPFNLCFNLTGAFVERLLKA